jgi:hypothetical protein
MGVLLVFKNARQILMIDLENDREHVILASQQNVSCEGVNMLVPG